MASSLPPRWGLLDASIATFVRDPEEVARLEPLPPKGSGPARDAQEEWYGPVERRLQLPDGREAHLDGYNPHYGAVGDFKHVAEGRSWYNPELLDDDVRAFAARQIDTQLKKLAVASQQIDGPDGLVEIVTTRVEVARYFEARMRALDIRGYVHVVEGGTGV